MTELDIRALQPGDTVGTLLMASRHQRGKIVTVVRVTPTQIVTSDGNRYWRRDGMELGAARHNRSRLVHPADPAVVDALLHTALGNLRGRIELEIKNSLVPTMSRRLTPQSFEGALDRMEQVLADARARLSKIKVKYPD